MRLSQNPRAAVTRVEVRGGNADTMRWKHESVENAKLSLTEFNATPVSEIDPWWMD